MSDDRQKASPKHASKPDGDLAGRTSPDAVPAEGSPPKTPSNRSLTPATAAALAVLATAFVVSLLFMVGNGGLTLTAAPTSRPSGDAAAVEGTPSPTPSPTPASTPGVAPSPGPAETPTPTASPTASQAPTPQPSSDRFALLAPCPDVPDCWIYVVRSGDNLYSIARYFGVPLREVQALNPWTRSGLRTGRELRIPTPTR